MAANKTRQTDASVEAYFAAIDDETRRADCKALAKLMTRATGHEPMMWGASIVGFGSYHYVHDSGREGDMCAVGFSSRKGDISLYLAHFPGWDDALAKLGKHKTGKGCLYVKRLAEIDVKVLEQIVAKAAAERVRGGG